MALPDPYGRVAWRGVTMDRITVAALTAVEEKLGRPIDTVYQGSYHVGVGVSAGTHDGGGAIDCWDRDPQTLCWLMRDVGCFAAWIRNPSQGNWPYHCHGVLYGNTHLASLAESQVDMYRKGYNGLGWYAYKDDFGRRPSPIVPFNYHGVTGDSMDFKDQIPGVKGDHTVGDALAAVFDLQRSLANFKQGELARDKNERERDAAIKMTLQALYHKTDAEFESLTAEVKDDATKEQINRVRVALLAEMETLSPEVPA